ncbi:hypothetical protein TTHERM_01120590 (macronuclear) [Tetrahymena thermophila SB210]|uniref:Uncharacterized protein n=1 Tax=Tetrahymena thermophila (strain SB210) TaxID=312017 RepID=Q23S32_TETTS|nr:hypothetical protein TTHERM_01120590 [Tetrahymena thermophila SB210]EAR99315.1 hypothetical protein TTHERM_01120590 [Tetrahymena thermophila SB210]|eukprot:XP_001019560.1 hypothetical protein TTHERM_01120590 [Tetrahymena thermophila SB210]
MSAVCQSRTQIQYTLCANLIVTFQIFKKIQLQDQVSNLRDWYNLQNQDLIHMRPDHQLNYFFQSIEENIISQKEKIKKNIKNKK